MNKKNDMHIEIIIAHVCKSYLNDDKLEVRTRDEKLQTVKLDIWKLDIWDIWEPLRIGWIISDDCWSLYRLGLIRYICEFFYSSVVFIHLISPSSN